MHRGWGAAGKPQGRKLLGHKPVWPDSLGWSVRWGLHWLSVCILPKAYQAVRPASCSWPANGRTFRGQSQASDAAGRTPHYPPTRLCYHTFLGSGAVHQKLDNVLAHQQVLSQQQQAILMSVSSTLASFHLPPSSLGSAARQRLRKEVLSAYAALDANDWTWCVATGRFWPPLADTNTKVHHVRACHIFQRKWGIVDWVRIVWVLQLCASSQG